jgi:hypothetical protein
MCKKFVDPFEDAVTIPIPLLFLTANILAGFETLLNPRIALRTSTE